MEDTIAHTELQEEYSSFHNVVGLLDSMSEPLSLLQCEQRASDCSMASLRVESYCRSRDPHPPPTHSVPYGPRISHLRHRSSPLLGGGSVAGPVGMPGKCDP